MKVEFIQSDVLGATLFVDGNEFKKVNDNEVEFESLTYATTAFAKYFDVEYTISCDECNAVMDFLEKNSAVIFSLTPEGNDVEISVSNNNRISRVLYYDYDGQHLKRRGHFDPKAMNRIKKRHEEEKYND